MKNKTTAALNFFLLLFLLCPLRLWAEISMETDMDWATGLFHAEVSHSLDQRMSPSDHPQTLALLERKLPPLLVNALSSLFLNHSETLAQRLEKEPQLSLTLEKSITTMEREWSRLSSDFMRLEAAYILDIHPILLHLLPPKSVEKFPNIPVGWRPLPEDGWSGIIIYVPSSLPLRGTKRQVQPVPALRARLFSSSLQILLDPVSMEKKGFTYRTLSDDSQTDEVHVGRRPYRVMAREIYGENPCDFIIAEEDALNLLTAPSGRQALLEGRVLILFDTIPQ